VNQPGPGRAEADQPAGPGPAPGPDSARRRPLVVALVALAGLGCLAVAVLAGRAALAEQTRRPTAAERTAAAATAVAGRWRSWPAGHIFPARLGYVTTLGNAETAHRIGIAPGYRCAAALDAALARRAHRASCQAGLRATYADQLQGVIYTVGVLAFKTPAQARAFARGLPVGPPPTAALRALGLPGTVSARFTDAARQAATTHWDGPYVVLTVAGYADGRLARATGQYDAPVFDAASQLATEIMTPLGRPAVVNCASRQWAC